MNKTEAVEVLQDYLNEIRGFIAFEVGSALDLAIKALQDAELNCVHYPRYHETEDDSGVHGHCEADKDDLIRREDAIKEMLRAHPMPSEFLKSLDIPSSCFEAGFRAAYFAVERTPSADSVSTEYAIECIDQCRERKNREITIIRERKNREIAELKKQLADRPTGEWITCGTETGALGVSYAEKKCSHCGWAHSLLIPSNYCPNCGARMKGGAE